MKKLTKKLFIIAMIAAGAALSKPAFAMEASNSSGTNQYSNVDLTEYETYRNYLEKINQLKINFPVTFETVATYGGLAQLVDKLYFKCFDLLEKADSLRKKLYENDGILKLETALKNAYNCKNVNNSEYMKYKNKFFDLYDSLTEEYDSICHKLSKIKADIKRLPEDKIPNVQIVYQWGNK